MVGTVARGLKVARPPFVGHPSPCMYFCIAMSWPAVASPSGGSYVGVGDVAAQPEESRRRFGGEPASQRTLARELGAEAEAMLPEASPGSTSCPASAASVGIPAAAAQLAAMGTYASDQGFLRSGPEGWDEDAASALCARGGRLAADQRTEEAGEPLVESKVHCAEDGFEVSSFGYEFLRSLEDRWQERARHTHG